MRLPNRKPGKYTFSTFDHHMTTEAASEMKKKLHRLKTILRPPLMKLVRELAENGDFSENAEYQITKGRLRAMNRTIDELEYQIPRAIIIEKPKNTVTVQIEHTVTVQTSAGKKVQWTILGSKESDPLKGIISYQSPLSKKLIGKHIGEKATVKIPSGITVYRIIHIE